MADTSGADVARFSNKWNVATIQEALEKIEAMEEKIKDLEKRVKTLEGK